MSGERERKPNQAKRTKIIIVCIVIVVLAVGGILGYNYYQQTKVIAPEIRLKEYMELINTGDYEEMYEYLDGDSKKEISEEDFISRNKGIYEGIEADGVTTDIGDAQEITSKQSVIGYDAVINTVAGEVSFSNESRWNLDEENSIYKLDWDSTLIYPSLRADYKVRVNTLPAERGTIYDRNGNVLAGKGTASSVGLVPGKMTDETSLSDIAQLLGSPEEAIETALAAPWVNDESFVPLKTVKRSGEIDPDADALALQEALLAIPGVMITDTYVRSYPYGKGAAHLTGYVQNAAAEDIESDDEGIYDETSVIGKTGVEALYEERLRAVDGAEILILDENGDVAETVAVLPAKAGEDITLTVDIKTQVALYNQYSEDKGCSAVMNPKTGEVLALISTPAYDPNDFVLGLTAEQWNALNDDEATPLTSRFRGLYVPGSSFKPVTAGVGLSQGAFSADESFGSSGLSWQKDSSWGSYYITTLHEYEPAILKNALIYSDNIYFAKAALKIGGDGLVQGLTDIGFGESIPFDFGIAASTFSSDGSIDSEIQLADSGYGQGEIQVSILHLASIYSALLSGGDMIQPYIELKESATPEYWIEDAFSSEAADTVLDGLKAAIEDPSGTGHAASLGLLALAGKTGTAEIKESQDDTSGTELGWFCIFTTDMPQDESALVISMVEDVKDRGGSSYLVEKSSAIFEAIYNIGS